MPKSTVLHLKGFHAPRNKEIPLECNEAECGTEEHYFLEVLGKSGQVILQCPDVHECHTHSMNCINENTPINEVASRSNNKQWDCGEKECTRPIKDHGHDSNTLSYNELTPVKDPCHPTQDFINHKICRRSGCGKEMVVAEGEWPL